MLKTRPLHPRYGVQIFDIPLAELGVENGFRQIRDAFENHSLLYFADQQLSDIEHLALGELFGPREDRTIHPQNPDPVISLVSNVKSDQSLLAIGERRLLELQSNMLWHTDSTFLPVPALANILVGRVIPKSGTFTEFTSTRIAWQDMPENLAEQTRELYFRHSYSHSRRQIDTALAAEEKFCHWGEQVWKSIWKNPLNGEEALYIASHACGVPGMQTEPALALIDELINWCGQTQYIYAHPWRVGDVLIWDERAMLHRAVPWNYQEARTLSSICISAQQRDGLDRVRYPSSQPQNP
jgi:alpha-ketoglutarate-dependent 2,4-dichlorophenoxyacetate dioxygenase